MDPTPIPRFFSEINIRAMLQKMEDEAPYSVQSIQSIMTEQAAKSEDCPLFKMIQPGTHIANSPCLNYVVVGEDGAAAEGEPPLRRVLTTATVTIPGRMSPVCPESAFAATREQTTRNRVAMIQAQIESGLFTADKSLVPQHFNGIGRQIELHAPKNVLDNRGATLNLKAISAACGKSLNEDGKTRITHIFVSHRTFANVVNEAIPDGCEYGVVHLGNGELATDPATGGVVYRIDLGDVILVPDSFIQPGQPAVDAGFGPEDRPVAPRVVGSLKGAAGSCGLFGAEDAGVYIYKVAAFNARGFSPTVTTDPVFIGAGDVMNLDISAGDYATTGYVVYRSERDGDASTCREVFRLAKTGASQTIRDSNHHIPGTSRAYFLAMDDKVPSTGEPSIQWAQLSDLQTCELGAAGTGKRWLVLLEGGLIVRIPSHNAMLCNIGEPSA